MVTFPQIPPRHTAVKSGVRVTRGMRFASSEKRRGGGWLPSGVEGAVVFDGRMRRRVRSAAGVDPEPMAVRLLSERIAASPHPLGLPAGIASRPESGCERGAAGGGVSVLEPGPVPAALWDGALPPSPESSLPYATRSLRRQHPPPLRGLAAQSAIFVLDRAVGAVGPMPLSRWLASTFHDGLTDYVVIVGGAHLLDAYRLSVAPDGMRFPEGGAARHLSSSFQPWRRLKDLADGAHGRVPCIGPGPVTGRGGPSVAPSGCAGSASAVRSLRKSGS
jgi:hypothetical protein